MAENIAVLCCVAGAAIYAAWRIYKVFRGHNRSVDGCAGCPLNDACKTTRENCMKKQQNRK